MTKTLTVLFDACVLYPAPLRDLLLHLVQTGLFHARWTNRIHDEWINNLLENRPNINLSNLMRTRKLMNQSVRDCLIQDFEHLINSLNLPDPKDRHILAAAIHGNADVILTFNLKDFPNYLLSEMNIVAIHPNIFISSLLKLDGVKAIRAIRNHRHSLKNPPKTSKQYLETLSKQGLPLTVSHLSAFQDQF